MMEYILSKVSRLSRLRPLSPVNLPSIPYSAVDTHSARTMEIRFPTMDNIPDQLADNMNKMRILDSGYSIRDLYQKL